MDRPDAPAAADVREFLRSAPDFEAVELGRSREPAREVELEPIASGLQGVDEP